LLRGDILLAINKQDCTVYPVIVPEASSLKSINFYIISHGQSLSLIDAGWNNESCWESLLTTLKRNDFDSYDITEIILTHHHNDHMGLVNRIVSKHPIPVYASPLSIPRLRRDQAFLEMRVDFFAKIYQEMGCGEAGVRQIDYLTSALKKNKHQALQANIIEIHDNHLLNFNVLLIPGHAPDQLAFYDQNRNWLFAGDLLFDHIASNALVEPDVDGKRLPSLTQHIHSLKKCEALNAEIVFSGHGSLIKNPNKLIQKRLTSMKEKSERLLQLIESGIETGSELAQSYYKKKYHPLFSLVMSEIIGHLDYLETQNKIKKDLVNGIWRYAVK
jgi:glyoxylase-like metal-dependent hydrolase (beta-lactamase superfamily II)